MEFGRSGGVWGHGTDHTKRFPRTLAGFGLPGHGGSRFSCFGEILETHFITKYLQIGPRASRLVLGFFGRPGHQIKPINFQKKYPFFCFGNLVNLPKSSLFDKMASFFFAFFCFFGLLLGPSWPDSAHATKQKHVRCQWEMGGQESPAKRARPTGAQKKAKTKDALLSKNDDFGRLTRFPENIYLFGSFFGKIIGFIWCPGLPKNPRTNLEARGPIWR